MNQIGWDRLQLLEQLVDSVEFQSTLDQASAAGRPLVDLVLRGGGHVYAAGNGGSHSQAQHFAAELTGRYRRERRPLPAVALGSNPAHVTAVANDYGYEHVFSRELRALARRGDVCVLLSTSGISPSVLNAADTAHECGCFTIAIIGAPGYAPGRWAQRSDVCVRIPSTDTSLVQEATLHVLHSMCAMIDAEASDGEA